MRLAKLSWVAGSLGAAMLGVWGVSLAHDAVRADLTAYASSPPAIVIAATPLPSPIEIERLRDGIAASDVNDWASVRNARAAARDPLIRKMLTWRLACEGASDASFDEVREVLDNLKDWPCRDTMRRRAEQLIFDSALSYPEREAWLKLEGPATGDGKVALAQALRAQGRRAEAEALVRETWRTDTLTGRAESIALSEFGGALDQDDHAARVDISLWRDDRAAAGRLLSRLSAGDRLLANARIVLQTRPRRGVQIAVDAVPGSLRDHPGFMYDRARYTRRSGAPERALPVAAEINALAAPKEAREKLFQERRLYVPRALRAGDYDRAYRLAANHGIASGSEFADGEWLAGWIALRFKRDPALADRHFTALDQNVSSPVSKARSLYWRALSRKALGDEAQAQALLQSAAAFNFVYYGQLAAAKLQREPPLALPDAAQISPQARAAFESKEVVRALKLMAQVGDRRDFESIAYYLDNHLETPDEYELLAQLAREQGFARTAVRTAKSGMFRGVVAPEAAYPMIAIPSTARRPGSPEPALIYAITRQESEFDPNAVSPVGARGLMQLMPATARRVAANEGLPYELGRLTADPDYNMTLGASYLQQMLEQWNGSYVLSIASYNAGPSRAAEWIADWGDPRNPGVDVVDWVELIPFSETRNYVQRVLENVQVYRHRIARTPTPILIEKDLRRGAYSQG